MKEKKIKKLFTFKNTYVIMHFVRSLGAGIHPRIAVITLALLWVARKIKNEVKNK